MEGHWALWERFNSLVAAMLYQGSAIYSSFPDYDCRWAGPIAQHSVHSELLRHPAYPSEQPVNQSSVVCTCYELPLSRPLVLNL